MSVETELAARGIKFTAQGIKLIAFVLFIALVCALAWFTADRVATLQTEKEGLLAYKASIERRDELSSTADDAMHQALIAAAAEASNQAGVLVVHDRATQEAANEDPDTATFLRSRIPDRLRRADLEARAARSEDK